MRAVPYRPWVEFLFLEVSIPVWHFSHRLGKYEYTSTHHLFVRLVPVHPFSSPTDFFFYISHHDLLQEAIVCKIFLNEGYLWLSYIIIYVKRQNNKIAKAIKSEHIIALCSITAWFHPACCLSLLLQDLCLCQVLQEFVCGKLYEAIYGEVSHFVAPFPPYESPVHQNRTE